MLAWAVGCVPTWLVGGHQFHAPEHQSVAAEPAPPVGVRDIEPEAAGAEEWDVRSIELAEVAVLPCFTSSTAASIFPASCDSRTDFSSAPHSVGFSFLQVNIVDP